MKRANRVSKMAQFRDDLVSAAKIFVRLNSYRKLNGFRKIEWNEILCELAVSRSHQLVRSGTGIVHLLQIGGAKFNLGVSYVDVSTYGPIEENRGNQIAPHRMIESAWMSHPGFSEAVLDPLAKFGAISVYRSEKAVCTTIFITIMPPSSFSPRRLKSGEDGRRKVKKKTKKGKKQGAESSTITSSGSDTDSQDESIDLLEIGDTQPQSASGKVIDSKTKNVDNMEAVGKEQGPVGTSAALSEVIEMAPTKPVIQEMPLASETTKKTLGVALDLDQQIREAAMKTWTDGQN